MHLAMETDCTDFPDLPGLESVESRGSGLLIAAAFNMLMSGVFVAAIAHGFIVYREYLPRNALIMVWAVFALSGWVVLRFLLDFWRFKTGGNGLTLRAVLRRRFVPWISVTEATMHGTRLRLRTTDGLVTVPLRSLGDSQAAAALAASVWQHLRRLGRAEGMELTEEMRRIWQPVPESIPQEQDWEHRIPRSCRMGQAAALIFFLVMLVASCWYAVSLGGAYNIALGCVLTVCYAVLMCTMLAPEALRVAEEVRLREGYLEARTLRGWVYLPWTDVSGAGWTQRYLYVRSRSRRAEVWIRLVSGDRDSETLVLGTIRRLRTAGVPQPIPLPPTSVVDKDFYGPPAATSRDAALRWQAYLRTLEPAAARRLRATMCMQYFSLFLAITVSLTAACLGWPEAMVHALHGAPADRFFIHFLGIAAGVPLLVVTVAAVSAGFPLLARRLAAPYWKQWDVYERLGRGKPAQTAIVLLSCVASVAALALYVNSYTRFTDSGIGIRRFENPFVEEQHPWADVRQVSAEERTIYHGGGWTHRTVYHIRFRDGRGWQFDEENASGKCELRQAVEFAARRSGHPMVRTVREE